jgi:hypothetical protein
LVSSWWPHLCTIRPNFTSILKMFCTFISIWLECFWTYKLGLDIIWYGVIQHGRSPFVRIALLSSLMLWLKVVPSDGMGILPLICAWPPRGCTIQYIQQEILFKLNISILYLVQIKIIWNRTHKLSKLTINVTVLSASAGHL